jgi:hypothetical protein
MPWIEFRAPWVEADARAASSEGDIAPDAMSEMRVDLTLADRTLAHCAKPSVPPSDLNYKMEDI